MVGADITSVQRSTHCDGEDGGAGFNGLKRKVSKSYTNLNLSRSPSVIGGKVEEFRDISVMIDFWKELEKTVTMNGGGEDGDKVQRKRSSKKIPEYATIFGV